MIYRTLQVPALGAAQAARTRAVPLCHFVTFPPPRGGLFPQPLPAPSFLMEEKMEKDHLRGTLSPLKIPLWGSPLAVSPTPPRPGSLVVTTGISRAKGCAFYTEKLCSL